MSCRGRFGIPRMEGAGEVSICPLCEPLRDSVNNELFCFLLLLDRFGKLEAALQANSFSLSLCLCRNLKGLSAKGSF